MLDSHMHLYQVKKRCRWLHRFTHDVLAGLPGSAGDPFGGAAIDMNSLGGLQLVCMQHVWLIIIGLRWLAVIDTFCATMCIP